MSGRRRSARNEAQGETHADANDSAAKSLKNTKKRRLIKDDDEEDERDISAILDDGDEVDSSLRESQPRKSSGAEDDDGIGDPDFGESDDEKVKVVNKEETISRRLGKRKSRVGLVDSDEDKPKKPRGVGVNSSSQKGKVGANTIPKKKTTDTAEAPTSSLLSNLQPAPAKLVSTSSSQDVKKSPKPTNFKTSNPSVKKSPPPPSSIESKLPGQISTVTTSQVCTVSAGDVCLLSCVL
jgi:hypothetical protein